MSATSHGKSRIPARLLCSAVLLAAGFAAARVWPDCWPKYVAPAVRSLCAARHRPLVAFGRHGAERIGPGARHARPLRQRLAAIRASTAR